MASVCGSALETILARFCLHNEIKMRSERSISVSHEIVCTACTDISKNVRNVCMSACHLMTNQICCIHPWWEGARWSGDLHVMTGLQSSPKILQNYLFATVTHLCLWCICALTVALSSLGTCKGEKNVGIKDRQNVFCIWPGWRCWITGLLGTSGDGDSFTVDHFAS